MIHLAVIYNQAEIVELLIDLGSPINKRNAMGKTPLAYSHYNKNFIIIKILIDALADPREINFTYGKNSDTNLKKIDEFLDKARQIWNENDGLIRVMKIKKLIYLEKFVNL